VAIFQVQSTGIFIDKFNLFKYKGAAHRNILTGIGLPHFSSAPNLNPTAPLPTTNYFLATNNCLLLTAYCLLLTAYCLLPTGDCRLMTADCFLATAVCLLPTGDCQLLPHASRLTTHTFLLIKPRSDKASRFGK